MKDAWKHRSVWTACLLAICGALAQERNPAILFASPHGAAHGFVDLAYLAELRPKGFEVDFTERGETLTWERIQPYNVVVVYEIPAGDVGEAAAALLERFAAAGGGVFCFPTEHNILRHRLAQLNARLDIRVPTERIQETDPAKTAFFPRMPGVPAAYTENVARTPVTDGVTALWYPFSPSYNCSHTTPLIPGPAWTVVARGSATATSVAVDLAQSLSQDLAGSVTRPEPVRAPVFFATRAWGAGRAAYLNQWRVYTVGSGTKWLFDRRILERGFDERPSHMGRLLKNTFRWLAEPSLAGDALGGYVTPQNRLAPPNLNPDMARRYRQDYWPYDRETVTAKPGPRNNWPLFKGLFGARTALSSGTGTVAAYAAAARQAGLDFVVFFEDFAAMTPAKLERLNADCAAASSDEVQMYPGLSIRDNIGNHMFLIARRAIWIPDHSLTGPDKSLFYRQAVDENGAYTGYGTPALDWALQSYHGEIQGNIGYYHIGRERHANRLPDYRLYSMAAIRSYENGRRVSDVTGDFLLTAAGTLPPTPIAVNIVVSPEALRREAERERGLTFAQARARNRVFEDAFRWTHQYDAVNVFPSDGPRILAWPGCHRVGRLGAENFVTAGAPMPSPVLVQADKGLREIRIYNGAELFRRFLPGGANEWGATLVLDGRVQRNLVMIVEDIAGGTAVSFARRCWKDGGREVVFCSDHVNDCKSGGMLLGRGPLGMLVNWPPPLPHPIAGDTWDGGPAASLPLSTWRANLPRLITKEGIHEGGRFNQTPILEFTDPGAAAVLSRKDELFDPAMARVVNPWHTFGPVGYPPQLLTFTQQYREWLNPSVGVPPTGWAGPGVRSGGNASIYRLDLRFMRDAEMPVADLLADWLQGLHARPMAAVGEAEAPAREVELLALDQPERIRLESGDWFALYARDLNSAQVLFVRGEPLELHLTSPGKPGGRVMLRPAANPWVVTNGQTYRLELATLGFPVDEPVHTLDDVVRVVHTLAAPPGFELIRGERDAASAGVIDLAPADGAVEFTVPRLTNPPRMTLPVRVKHLNRRWAAGLFLRQGYVKGDHLACGTDAYRPLGIDFDGCAYVPVYAHWADHSHILAGHPVVAGPEGGNLFIEVTRVHDAPATFHVAVNNPTDATVTTTVRTAMAIPGLLDLEAVEVTLAPGERRVLR